jgi:hypothetical protein
MGQANNSSSYDVHLRTLSSGNEMDVTPRESRRGANQPPRLFQTLFVGLCRTCIQFTQKVVLSCRATTQPHNHTTTQPR